MAKRKGEVGRSTGIARDLAAERIRELEEKIRTLESGEADQGRPTSVAGSEEGSAAGSEEGSAGGSAGELTEEQEITAGAKSWVNEEGNICIGRQCIVTEATPAGLKFVLNPESCDPETREAFVAAMIRGTSMTFN